MPAKGMSRRWAVCWGTGGMAGLRWLGRRSLRTRSTSCLLCLFAVEVADDGDDGVIFAVVGAVEGADVDAFGGCQPLCLAPPAVGVVSGR